MRIQAQFCCTVLSTSYLAVSQCWPQPNADSLGPAQFSQLSIIIFKVKIADTGSYGVPERQKGF